MIIFVTSVCDHRGLVDLLRSQGKEVYLVSGGFRQLIEPFAEYLSIPEENLFCNRLLFNSKGKFGLCYVRVSTILYCSSAPNRKVLWF